MSDNTVFTDYARAALVINSDHIANNVKSIRKLTAPHTMLMAVVKANGYGHGIYEVSKAALHAGADCLGVTTVHEGLSLRQLGVDAPILLLSPVFEEEFDDIINGKLTSTVFNLAECNKLSQAAQRLNKRADIHIKIDTGMNRIGYNSQDTDFIAREVSDISRLPYIEIRGIYSHLATSISDAAFAKEQFLRFMNVVHALEACGLHIPIKHISNSGGVINNPEFNLDMVRCGIILYGLAPCSTPDGAAELARLGFRPALALKSRVSHVKTVKKGESVGYGRSYTANEDIIVASVPIGYADGISRKLSNRGKVLINGHFCNIIGNVCMDQLMVDATGAYAKLRDEVVFIGQSDRHSISAEDMAALQESINYEVATSLSLRIPTYYV